MSEYQDIRFEVRDRVATITLDRPESRNAFGGSMRAELEDAYRRCDADDEIRAVVLTGTPPAFCAGADLSGGGETFGAPDPSTFSAAAIDPPAWEIRKPVIAAVNGHAIGLGLTLAIQCDLRFMAADAKYGVVQVRRGVMGDAYVHWALPRIVGMANAAEILLTGATFDGHDMQRLGIASRCLPDDEVLAGRVGDGTRHRGDHRAALGRLQQASALAELRARPRRGRPAGDRAAPPPDGQRRCP